MWTYSIEDNRGHELAHGDERSIRNRHNDRLDTGLPSRLFMWAPGARPLTSSLPEADAAE